MKNALLYYQGGGYSGCFWEWNCCGWDESGKWFDIFSSGSGGLETEEEALSLIRDRKQFREAKAELLNYTNNKRFERFQNDNNAYLVLNIAKVLAKKNKNVSVTCSFCGGEQEPNDCHTIDGDNYNIVCEYCLCSHSCSCCESVIKDDTELIFLTEQEEKDFEFTYGGAICSRCYRDMGQQFKIQQGRELLFKALLTGDIDLFGNELRDNYWLV